MPWRDRDRLVSYDIFIVEARRAASRNQETVVRPLFYLILP